MLPISQAKSFADVKMRGITRPKCEECGRPAEIVCASPRWHLGFPDEFGPDDKKARFCCRDHPEATEWYWMWLIPKKETDGDGITLREWDDLQHVAQKTWGGPFIGWLFKSYNLRDSE